MRSPLVKICGISHPEHARIAIEAGADFIGIVFYPPSIRNVTLDQARTIADAVQEIGRGRVQIVGLFVNASVDAMNAAVASVGLDLIQLSGDETPGILPELTRPAFASIRIDSAGRGDEEASFRTWISATPSPLAIHVDSHVPGMYGGTGTVADWFVAADFAQRFPIILAGGLAPDNVAAAIQRVQPAVVDVSSGVETAGRKDPDKIRAFISAARGASIPASATLATQGGTA